MKKVIKLLYMTCSLFFVSSCGKLFTPATQRIAPSESLGANTDAINGESPSQSIVLNPGTSIPIDTATSSEEHLALASSSAPVGSSYVVNHGGACTADVANWVAWLQYTGQYDYGDYGVAACVKDQPAYTNAGNNWGSDKRISMATAGGTLEVTTSVALAGAIASVKFNNKELINSYRGAGFQYNTHADNLGECLNPTEAGSYWDDMKLTGWPAGWPYMGTSSSILLTHALDSAVDANGALSIRTSSYPAYYASYLGGTYSGMDGCVPTYNSTAPYSDWYMQKQVSLGEFRKFAGYDGKPIDNVISLHGQFATTAWYGTLDINATIFTNTNVFDKMYAYSPYNASNPEAGAFIKFSNSSIGAIGVPLIVVAKADQGDIALGMLPIDAMDEDHTQSAPENVWAFYPSSSTSYSTVPFAQLTSSSYFRQPAAKTLLYDTTYYVVGTLSSVKSTLWSLSKLVKTSGYVGRFSSDPLTCTISAGIVPYSRGGTDTSTFPVRVYKRLPYQPKSSRVLVLETTAYKTPNAGIAGQEALTPGWFGAYFELPAGQFSDYEYIVDVVPVLNGVEVGPMIPNRLTPPTLKCHSNDIVELRRSYAKTRWVHLHHNVPSAQGLGYEQPDGIIGYMSKTPGDGKFPIYSCFNNLSYNDKPDYNCTDPNTTITLLGYIWATETPTRVPLYRCSYSWNGTYSFVASTSIRNDHILTVNYGECTTAGYTMDGVVGYIAASADAVADPVVVAGTDAGGTGTGGGTGTAEGGTTGGGTSGGGGSPGAETEAAQYPVIRYLRNDGNDLLYWPGAYQVDNYTKQGRVFGTYQTPWASCTIPIYVCQSGNNTLLATQGCSTGQTPWGFLGYTCWENEGGNLRELVEYWGPDGTAFTGPVNAMGKFIETTAYDFINAHSMQPVGPLGWAPQ